MSLAQHKVCNALVPPKTVSFLFHYALVANGIWLDLKEVYASGMTG